MTSTEGQKTNSLKVNESENPEDAQVGESLNKKVEEQIN